MVATVCDGAEEHVGEAAKRERSSCSGTREGVLTDVQLPAGWTPVQNFSASRRLTKADPPDSP